MAFAKRVFQLAGLYGLVVVTPLYVLEGEVARRFGPLTQPLWYYGFAGVTVAFQLVYLQIGRDPVRFRPMMPLALLAKLSFGTAAAWLYFAGRTPGLLTASTMPDLIWVVFFALAYARTPKA